jgi:hypothetical protein
MILPKRKKERMNVRVVEKKESAKHRKFVRAHVCIVVTGGGPLSCAGGIEFAHVRAGLPEGELAGMAQKPSDVFAVPMCSAHHSEQHRIGERSFERLYGVSLLKTALALARVSPDLKIREKVKGVIQ